MSIVDTITAPSTTVKVSRKAVDIANQLREYRAIKSRAEKMVKTLQEELEAEMQGAEVGTHRGIVVAKRVHSHNTKTDTKMLALAFPEAYDATVTVTEYDYLKV